MTGRKRVIMTFEEFKNSVKLVTILEEKVKLVKEFDYPADEGIDHISLFVYLDMFIVEFNPYTSTYYLLLHNIDYLETSLDKIEEILFDYYINEYI